MCTYHSLTDVGCGVHFLLPTKRGQGRRDLTILIDRSGPTSGAGLFPHKKGILKLPKAKITLKLSRYYLRPHCTLWTSCSGPICYAAFPCSCILAVCFVYEKFMAFY